MKRTLLFYLTFLFSVILFGVNAQITVKGVVTDAQMNEPMIGVTILEKGTSNGTVTGLDGDYTLSVNEGSTLVITYVGYTPKEIAVSNQTTINVV